MGDKHRFHVLINDYFYYVLRERCLFLLIDVEFVHIVCVWVCVWVACVVSKNTYDMREQLWKEKKLDIIENAFQSNLIMPKHVMDTHT